MIASLAVVTLPTLLGIACALAGKLFPEKMTTLLGGATLGLAVVITFTYTLSTFFSLNTALLISSAFTCAGLAACTLSPAVQLRRRWQELAFDRTAAVLLGILALLFALIAPKLLIAREGGLYTGIINAYGDVAWHLANITTFAAGQSAPPENPILAGTRLTYPFMTNFFSALLLKTGASFAASVDAVALVMIPLLLTLLYCFTHALTHKKSVAVLTLLLFLFGGAALGWTRLAGDWQESGASLVEFLTHLPARDYSGVGTDEQGFHFLNPVTTLLLPQRSFLFAFPLALTILLLLAPKQPLTAPRFLAAGIAAGVLPLFHAHTVLALLPAIAGFFAIDLWQGKRKEILQHWLLFLLPAAIIGLPEVLYYLQGGSEAGSFLRWSPRWLAGNRNFLWYWFMNTGLLIPATIIGLFDKKQSAEVKVVAGSGLLIFIVANLLLFAPWAWDNFKLFVYFFLFTLPLAATVAVRALRQPTYPGVRAAVIIAIGLHLLAAGLDIWKIALPTAREWQEWDKSGIEFAKAVQKKTQVGERVLTAANHNSPIVLAGHPRYLGFAAHVWSHGGDPWAREAAVKEFYEGRLQTLPELQPTYVVVSPQERGSYPNLIIRPIWQLVTQVGEYQLYRLPPN